MATRRLRDFLDQLHPDTVRLTPREYLAAERLLARGEGWTQTELAAALASLLACNREEWAAVERRFLDYLATELTVPPRDSDVQLVPPPDLRVRMGGASLDARLRRTVVTRAEVWRRRVLRTLRVAPGFLWVALGTVGVFAAVGLVIARLPSGPVVPTVEPEAIEPSERRIDPATEEPPRYALVELEPARAVRESLPLPPDPELDGVARALGWLSALWVLLGARFLWLPSAARTRAAERQARQRTTARDRRLILERQKAESRRALELLYHVESFPALSRQAIADSAEWLGRLMRREHGDELDADSTLERTIEAGGCFHPVLFPRLSRFEVVLLIDVEGGDHPWLKGFERVVDAWQRLGVPLLRYTFHSSPAQLRDCVSGRPLDLPSLARRTQGLPLILFSRQLSAQAAVPGRERSVVKPRRWHAGWLDECEAWPLRAWIDPDPRARGEMPKERRANLSRLERFGLVRFPLSDEGVVAMARWLADGGQSPLAPFKGTLPARPAMDAPSDPVANALRCWAWVGALVPHPTWDQLEALRRHFPEIGRVLPERACVQRLIEWLVEVMPRGSSGPDEGPRLEIPEAIQQRWQRELRAHDARLPEAERLEPRARALLLEQLAPNRPEDPLDAQWWEFKRAMHRAVLEPERADELLDWIPASAIRDEGMHWIECELERQDAQPHGAIAFSTAARERLEQSMRSVQAIAAGELLWGHPRVWARSTALALTVGSLAHFGLPPIASGLRESESFRVVQFLLVPRAWGLEKADLGTRPDMVRLAGGRFLMGSPETEAKRSSYELQHEVRVSAFWISRTEVSQAQYRAVMQDNLATECEDADLVGEELPVVCVSWLDAARFCNRLSELQGLEPAYEIEGDDVRWERETNGYRLPTEAEWEYAAHANRQTPYVGTNTRSEACAFGNVRDSDFGCDDGFSKLAPVDALRANGFGLYGMGGNVAEWVWDWYGDYESNPIPQPDPKGPTSGSYRGIRGASWDVYPRGARVAIRSRSVPSLRFRSVGIRLARSVDP